MKTIQTDVLVIGTGFGAAAPALRLAQAGAKVVMIEKGPKVQTADFRQTSDPQYILKYLKGTPGDNLRLTYAEALGGGSGFYEMVSLRAPTLAFEQLDDTGRLLWPAGVDRRTLDPRPPARAAGRCRRAARRRASERGATPFRRSPIRRRAPRHT